jgi:Tfp pilus assembly protein PilF
LADIETAKEYYKNKDYENALQCSEVVLSVTPNSPFAQSTAAVAYAETGRLDEAKGLMARLKEVNAERWQKLVDDNEALKNIVE